MFCFFINILGDYFQKNRFTIAIISLMQITMMILPLTIIIHPYRYQ